MSESNKLIAHRLLDALWNQQNFGLVDALLASDYDGHSSTEFDGPEGAKAFVPMLRSAFPDFQFTVEDQIAEGDKVVTRWSMSGTHKGEFQGMSATGRQMSITGITIFRIASDKVIEGWTNEDLLGFYQQIGNIPSPEQAGRSEQNENVSR